MESNNTNIQSETNTNANTTPYQQGNRNYRGRGGNYKKVNKEKSINN